MGDRGRRRPKIRGLGGFEDMGLGMRKKGEKQARDTDLRRNPEKKKPVRMRGAERVPAGCMRLARVRDFFRLNDPEGLASNRVFSRSPPENWRI